MHTLLVAAVHDPAVGFAAVTAAHSHGLSTVVVHAQDAGAVNAALRLSEQLLLVLVHLRDRPLVTVTLVERIQHQAGAAMVVGLADATCPGETVAAIRVATGRLWTLPRDATSMRDYLQQRLQAVVGDDVGGAPRTFVLDATSFRAAIGPAVVQLTPTECALLAELMCQAGQVVSRQALSRAVWGHDGCAGNILERHICRLRHKTRALGTPLIRTVHGIGYQFQHERHALV